MWIQNVRNERINDSGSAGESLIVPAPQQLHILPGRTLPLRMVQQLLRMISDQHFITAGLVESSPERLHRIFRRIFQGDQCCSSLPAEAEDQAGGDQLNLACQDEQVCLKLFLTQRIQLPVLGIPPDRKSIRLNSRYVST